MSLKHEFEQLVADGISESHILEFKQSEIISKKRNDKIAKEVSAFSNSAGGTLYIGIEERETYAHQLDGGTCKKNFEEWIEQAIANHVKPSLIGVQINSVVINGGRYYKVLVPKSADAPHQSLDNKYYRRSGTHSLPMEHYEIEDIRYRSLVELEPIEATLLFEQQTLAVLQIKNVSKATLRDVNVDFSADFGSATIPSDIAQLEQKKYKFFHSGDKHRYMLGQTFRIMSVEDTVKNFSCHIDYFDGVRVKSKTVSFDFSDYDGDLIPRVEANEQLKKIAKTLVKIEKKL